MYLASSSRAVPQDFSIRTFLESYSCFGGDYRWINQGWLEFDKQKQPFCALEQFCSCFSLFPCCFSGNSTFLLIFVPASIGGTPSIFAGVLRRRWTVLLSHRWALCSGSKPPYIYLHFSLFYIHRFSARSRVSQVFHFIYGAHCLGRASGYLVYSSGTRLVRNRPLERHPFQSSICCHRLYVAHLSTALHNSVQSFAG